MARVNALVVCAQGAPGVPLPSWAVGVVAAGGLLVFALSMRTYRRAPTDAQRSAVLPVVIRSAWVTAFGLLAALILSLQG
jgi:hypothetical protein